MQVSLHLAGFGPVSFEFDEIAHPAFIRLPNGSYLAFDDAVEDARMVTMLQRRILKRLDEMLSRYGYAAVGQRKARESAALSWYLTVRKPGLQKRAAVREAERILGLEPEPDPGLLTETQVREALTSIGEFPLRTEDGYGLRRVPVHQVWQGE